MDPLLAMFSADLETGQARLADTARRLVQAVRPDLAERLPFEDRSVFAEPLLFACLLGPQSPMTLDQILFGRMSVSARPSSIPVHTAADGTAELPGLGLLHTGRPSARLHLSADLTLAAGAQAVSHHWSPMPTVAESSIVLDRQISPALNGLFERAGTVLTVETGSGARDESELDRALGLIARLYPDYYSVLARTTRRIVLFHDPRLNSFAAPRAQGCVFLDLAHGRGAMYHAEDLLHQCGHVAFTAMTLDARQVLGANAETSLAGDRVDDTGAARTAYVVLHALATERFMAEGLLRLVQASDLELSDRHEATGRLAYILRRYTLDMVDLLDADVLVDRGLELGHLLLMDLRRLAAESEQHIRSLDLSGQPYNFNYPIFAARNPLHDWLSAHTAAACR